MCNDECDLKCVSKYKCKLETFDKIVIGCVFVILFASLVAIVLNSIQLANCRI